jgi:CheY-like chemotaxis protein
VGVGSVFTLDVPFRAAEGDLLAGMEPGRRVAGLESGQPPYRLLVVDDKAVNRALLVKMLAPLGFEVREAGDGQEAIEIWQEWAPHLIWMDMRMPVMDGYEATRRIKATTGGQATVIVALTASALEEDREVILSEGCDAYIRKPFRQDELFETLQKHLGVRFVYQEERRPQAPSGERRARQDESRGILTGRAAALPGELLDDLRQATVLGYQDEILRQIAAIEAVDPRLATELAGLARDYEHEKILAMIEKGVSDQ